jgi:hypothetical protein
MGYLESYRVKKALANGTLINPGCCEQCHKEGQVHGHHYLGYGKEHALDVKWLCRSCHGKAHWQAKMDIAQKIAHDSICRSKGWIFENGAGI